MVRTLIGAAALAVLCAAPADAQYVGTDAGVNNGRTGDDSSSYPAWSLLPSREYTPEDAGREHEIERRYNETLRTKIPDKKPVKDPWRNMRSVPAAAPGKTHERE